MKKVIFILGVVAGLVSSCGNDEKISELSWSDIPVTTEINLSRSELDVNDAINAFGMNVFNILGHETKDPEGLTVNMSFSPVSAALCLSMMGEAGDDALTASILETLGAEDLATLTSTSNKLMRFLPAEAEGERLELANSIWYHNVFTIKDTFKKVIDENYYAEVNKVELGTDDAKDMINSWVNAKTHGYIAKIFDDAPAVELNVVFVNVLFFKGEWSEKFDKSKTDKMTFKGTHGNTQIEMMHNTLYASCDVKENFIVMQLPYKGNCEAYFVLPNEGVAIDEVSTYITTEDLNIPLGFGADITLSLPKFSIFTSMYLNEVFYKLGFTGGYESLEKMGIMKDGQLHMFQKVSTNVDEDGTTAAVVTYNGLYGFAPHDKLTLTFDRPFLYFIKNNVTGSILLAGQVCDL